MHFVFCEHRHAAAIRRIFNDAIVHTTAMYDHEPRSADTIDRWIADKQASGHPLLGVETDQGELMGFATYGSFRTSPGYRFSIEHSVYVDSPFRGQGLGRELLTRLIQSATQHGFHTMIGGIDSGNRASISLHLSLGFAHCATIREAGFKFDRWLDLHFYQLILPAPEEPS